MEDGQSNANKEKENGVELRLSRSTDSKIRSGAKNKTSLLLFPVRTQAGFQHAGASRPQ